MAPVLGHGSAVVRAGAHPALAGVYVAAPAAGPGARDLLRLGLRPPPL